MTHDQEEANSMSTNLAILNEGVVQQVGKPVDLYNNPSNTFVANFLGTTNVIEGEIKDTIFKSKKGLVVKNINKNAKGTSILLRPQNLYLEQRNEKFEKFIGEVKTQEFLGNIVRYTIDIKGHIFVLDTLHEVDKKIYSPDEEIVFYLDTKKIKFL